MDGAFELVGGHSDETGSDRVHGVIEHSHWGHHLRSGDSFN